MLQQQQLEGAEATGENQALTELQAQIQAQAAATMAMSIGGMETDANSQLAGFGAFAPFNFDYNFMADGDDDEEYISDEEFQKGLSDQERRIFNALVISINQTHMIRQKEFQKRRMEYL